MRVDKVEEGKSRGVRGMWVEREDRGNQELDRRNEGGGRVGDSDNKPQDRNTTRLPQSCMVNLAALGDPREHRLCKGILPARAWNPVQFQSSAACSSFQRGPTWSGREHWKK